MSGFWHPLSAVYLREPRSLASTTVLRLLLRAEGEAEIVSAGDVMWPAVRHGQPLRVRAMAATARPARGEVVLVAAGPILEIARVVSATGAVVVAGDADGAPPRACGNDEILGRVEGVPRARTSARALRRVWLDVVEAIVGAPDSADLTETVRAKYDDQAVFYARLEGEVLASDLAEPLLSRVPPPARLLVIGSGAGRETLALESLGYSVKGVDFSPRMVERARAAAAERGSAASFVTVDVRHHDEPAGCWDAIVFTYDVYSFLPGSSARAALLTRMRGWLKPGGAVFLSARRVRGWRDRSILTLQRLVAALRGRAAEWGDSHTRWIDSAGEVRRSFVHVVTDRGLDREAAVAGFRRAGWRGGHGLFEPVALSGGSPR